MNQTTTKSLELHRLAFYMNCACLALVFGPLVILKLHIASSGDTSARWMALQYLPLLLIGGIVWLFAFIVSITSWIKKGNPLTAMSERWAALSLPICIAIVTIT